MMGGPGASEALLPNGPEVSMPVAELTRRHERSDALVPLGSRNEGLVAWREE